MIRRIQNILKPLTLSLALLTPIKAPQYSERLAHDVFQNEPVEVLSRHLTSGLVSITKKNFRGGIIKEYDKSSLKVLKERLTKRNMMVVYCSPLADCRCAYTENFGHFFAKRPLGRPHLGLDIFVTPYALKPKKPVKVVAPIGGVVIMEKHARQVDNLIGNSIIIMGRDGRRYAFEHLAKASDYNESIKLPKLGDYLNAGDAIGYIGHTGETTLWHLHLSVMTDEMLEKQLKSKTWQKIASESQYSTLCGQVNPLSEKDAGPIAKVLHAHIKDRH
ncbi:MAG: M23 family metallopeptidase [Clostridiaceae bacterium]|jgi:murein DD-endopeptidase MepM/ murein hydrolase activator NlpD|nr:M23 family metallopeptidase [Clostridiaceae bacterium]